MKTRKVISKGYTLEVVSWENDGDNYKTETVTVEDKNLAIALVNMCKVLFTSINRSKTGIGNTTEYEEIEAKERILDYMSKNPILCNGETEEEKLITICMGWNYKLLGESAYYYSRVYENVTITYSKEDQYIYLEEVTF